MLDSMQKLTLARGYLNHAREARLNQEWLEMYHYTAAAHALIVSARAAFMLGQAIVECRPTPPAPSPSIGLAEWIAHNRQTSSEL